MIRISKPHGIPTELLALEALKGQPYDVVAIVPKAIQKQWQKECPEHELFSLQLLGARFFEKPLTYFKDKCIFVYDGSWLLSRTKNGHVLRGCVRQSAEQIVVDRFVFSKELLINDTSVDIKMFYVD